MKGQTSVEKIVSEKVGKRVFAGDFLERLPVSKEFMNEVIAPPSICYFIEDFGDIFKTKGLEEKVFDPKRIFFFPDHSIPSCSIQVSRGVDLMRKFAAKTGIKMYKEGDGIEHVVLPEDGHIVPSDIVIGTDSHTDTHGALSALAFGVGTTEAVYAMATGNIYNFKVPETIKFNLNGKLPFGVYGKDIILYIIGMMGAGGCSKKAAEFSGPVLKELDMEDRFTMANMCVEMSARTGIFPFDKKTEKYLNRRAKWDYKILNSDPNANYSKIIDIDVSKIEPMVSFPHLPANATPISKIGEMIEKSKKSKEKSFVAVESDKINHAFIGSCTNGREKDLYVGASIFAEDEVHPDVDLVTIPGSRKVYNWATKKGILSVYSKAGANIESANCGPCFGKHMGVLSEKGLMISTSNRNYEGRMGSKEAKIFLASPATVAASAIDGKITDPRKYLNPKHLRGLE